MTAQQALLTPQPTLGPTADDLIALTDFDSISKNGRQQLIELIEKRIDVSISRLIALAAQIEGRSENGH